MYFLFCESLNFCFASEASELDSDGEPSAASIVRRWRAQMLEDKERIILQEKVFNAEEHFRNMCAAGGVSNNNAEVLNRRIKNARAELVLFIALLFLKHAHVRTESTDRLGRRGLVPGYVAHASPVSDGRSSTTSQPLASALDIRRRSCLSLIRHRGYL